MSERAVRPSGILALAIFFFVAAGIASIAGISLLLPGAIQDWLWQVNPRGRAAFQVLGVFGSLLLCVVSLACAVAGAGLWRARRWGYWTAVVVFGVQLLGDVVNVVAGIEKRAALGIPIVVLLLWFLRTQRVKAYFFGHDS